MAKDRVTANTLLLTGVSMKDLGQMVATMVLEHVPGRMVGATVGSGGMGWPMDKALKLIQMEMFVTKDNGLMMSPFVDF